jgi:hypothetical protein
VVFLAFDAAVLGKPITRGSVDFASTGDHSELIGTLPITRKPGAERRVVMSLAPHELPGMHPGDVLRTTSELQISTTCYLPEQRCIGRRYRFSPKTTARVVLARSDHATHGRGVVALSRQQSTRCHQKRPNRNHHCVFAFRTKLPLDHPSTLPCALDRCFVNFVVEAHHRDARKGDVEVMGADTPDGRVRDDKARLDAVVLRRPWDPHRYATHHERRKRLPLRSQGAARVVYSVKVRGLERGDVLVAAARQRTGLDGLAYPAFIGSSLVLARHPTAVHPGPLAKSAGSNRATVDEGNGFNCTHGRSAYQSPCVTRKVGALRIRHDVNRGGHPAPLYVNLVSHVLAKVAQPAKADAAPRVLDGGFLRVAHYSESASGR